MTDANFKSTIYLRNDVETDPITVTPILWLSNGKKFALKDVTLEPAGVAVININQALADQGLPYWATLTGYVEIQYTWQWDALCVIVWNVDVSHSLILTSGLAPSSPPTTQAAVPPQTNVLEGVWWKQEASVSGFVALSNTASDPIHAAVQVSDAAGNAIGTHSVTISSHGTKVVTMPELQGARSSAGGVRIAYTGASGTVIANGGLEDPAVGYSARMPFTVPPAPPTAAGADTYAELGLMSGAADPMMSFPAGTTFTPYSVVRNISDKPIQLTPTLWWMEGGAARFALSRTITVSPGQTQDLDPASLLSAAGLKTFNGSANLILDMQGTPGGLLLAAGSVDHKNTYVFEVMPTRVHEGIAKSFSYWSVANGDDTMVTLWNPADEAQDFIFTLFFTGGHYDFPIHLEARATRTFNVSEIIHNQIPDAEGNIIPATVHEGSARISGTLGNAQSILVSMDAGTYNVVKATCGEGCNTCDGSVPGDGIEVSPLGMGVGGTDTVRFIVPYKDGSQRDFTAQATWKTDNTSIATVQSAGVIKGVAAGSFTTTATASVPPAVPCCNLTGGCCAPASPLSGSGQGAVAMVKCTSPVTRGGTSTCTATGASGSTFSNWQFTDASTNTVTVTSNGTGSTWSGIMVTSGTVSVTVTSSDGTATPTFQVTVNPRNWTTGAASPASVPNGTFYTLPVPPAPTGLDAGLGQFLESTSNNDTFYSTFISDNGPNNGYGYYATQPTFTTIFQYEINPDLVPGSTFYTEQCGNYNAQTKPSGYISGSNLSTQTNRHEWNSSTESHYAFYSNSIAGANNPGNYVEARIAAPGTSQNTFDTATGAGLSGSSGRYNSILAATQVEPYGVNEDASGNFLGKINYAPYQSCN